MSVPEAAGRLVVVEQRQQDRPASGANVKHPRRRQLATLEQSQGLLNQRLRLGPGNQHGRVDDEVERHELSASPDVGDRLPAGAAPAQTPEAVYLGPAHAPFELQVEVHPSAADRVSQEQLGIEARRVGTVASEVGRGLGHELKGQLGYAASPASRRAWWFWRSGSTTTSRSPASIASSRYTGPSRRRSEMRFSLKL